jgi:hypothetical protein
MNTEADLQKIIDTLSDYVSDPVKALEDKTTLSRSTIQRFLRMKPIKLSNRELLFEACLTLIEQKHNKQLALQQKCQRILQLSLEFTKSQDDCTS